MADLIVTDVDGCVTPEESVAWDMTHLTTLINLTRGSAANKNSLPPITLCTGRPQPYIEVLAKLLDIRLPIICENGAVLYTLHDNWSRYAEGVTQDKIDGLRAIRAYLDNDVLPNHPAARYQFGKEAMLSVYSEEHDALVNVQRAVEAFIARGEAPPAVINLSHYYLNISMEGVNKGTALYGLMQEQGVSRENTVAIGDTVGDMPLRETVEYFACPANAHQAIKDVANYVSPESDIRGLVDILRLPECQQLF